MALSEAGRALIRLCVLRFMKPLSENKDALTHGYCAFCLLSGDAHSRPFRVSAFHAAASLNVITPYKKAGRDPKAGPKLLIVLRDAVLQPGTGKVDGCILVHGRTARPVFAPGRCGRNSEFLCVFSYPFHISICLTKLKNRNILCLTTN